MPPALRTVSRNLGPQHWQRVPLTRKAKCKTSCNNGDSNQQDSTQNYLAVKGPPRHFVDVLQLGQTFSGIYWRLHFLPRLVLPAKRLTLTRRHDAETVKLSIPESLSLESNHEKTQNIELPTANKSWEVTKKVRKLAADTFKYKALRSCNTASSFLGVKRCQAIWEWKFSK